MVADDQRVGQILQYDYLSKEIRYYNRKIPRDTKEADKDRHRNRKRDMKRDRK